MDVISILLGLAGGGAFGFFAERLIRGTAFKSRDEILEQAKRDGENLRKTAELAAKEEGLRRREEIEKDLNSLRDEIRNQERKLDKRESGLKDQQDDISKKERMLEATQLKLSERGKVVDARERELEKIIKQEQEQLYKISGLDQKTATAMLMDQLERELKNETGALILKNEAELKQQSEKQAREIIGMAIQKYASAHTSETTVSTLETQKEMEEFIRRQGAEAAQEADVPNLHEKLVDLMGRLYFRTSYSQNVLRHSIEVAHLTGMMAVQLGLNGNLARRCGFLHDIGKAADHEMEGGHPAVGAELLKRYGEKGEVVHAAKGHHDDIRPEYIYTVLVAAADACSASRPGARRETLEKYVRRLEELETLACGFPGVEQAFAVQAGREIRVIVNPADVNDREAAKLCRDLATSIEQQLTYPGEVKVTVLRETRVIEYAK